MCVRRGSSPLSGASHKLRRGDEGLANRPKFPIEKPKGEQKHLIGEFREAGWIVNGPQEMLIARCQCQDGHKTFIRSGSVSERYVNEKLSWLFNETCYSQNRV